MWTGMQMILFSLCLLAVIEFSQEGKSDTKLTVSRFYTHINNLDPPETSFLCTLRDSVNRVVPLTRCEYREYYSQNTWQFNDGPASPNKTCITGRVTMHGRYHGRGLRHGECGMTLGGYQEEDKFILGCRIRTAVGESWQMAAMMVFVSYYWIPFKYYMKPSITFALAGTNVTLIGKARDYRLNMCLFTVPPSHESVQPDFDTSSSLFDQNFASYYGRGLEQRECGVTFHDVQPEMSGFVTGYVTSKGNDRASHDFAELIVATEPEAAPLLSICSTGLLRPGDTLIATCLVKNSRPVANVTWFLDDEIVRRDNLDDGPKDDTWSWNHDLKSIEQRLRLPVNTSHNGKSLKCQAGHMASPNGRLNSVSYVVHVG